MSTVQDNPIIAIDPSQVDTDATAPDVRADAHWFAAEGIAAGVAHAMLVQPALGDVDAALEQQDWPRATASAAEALRWIACCREMLAGRSHAASGIDLDLIIATRPKGPIPVLASLPSPYGATRRDAEHAAEAVTATDRDLRAALPISLPTVRTPTGYQPATSVVSDLERLRHRLGLPRFDWERWIG